MNPSPITHPPLEVELLVSSDSRRDSQPLAPKRPAPVYEYERRGRKNIIPVSRMAYREMSYAMIAEEMKRKGEI